jgi:endoglucanase
MIADKRLFDMALKIAKERGIQYQIKKPIYGGTDAGAIHIAGRGIPSLVISCPARYIHSASSLTTIENLEETKRLVIAILEEINKDFKII